MHPVRLHPVPCLSSCYRFSRICDPVVTLSRLRGVQCAIRSLCGSELLVPCLHVLFCSPFALSAQQLLSASRHLSRLPSSPRHPQLRSQRHRQDRRPLRRLLRLRLRQLAQEQSHPRRPVPLGPLQRARRAQPLSALGRSEPGRRRSQDSAAAQIWRLLRRLHELPTSPISSATSRSCPCSPASTRSPTRSSSPPSSPISRSRRRPAPSSASAPSRIRRTRPSRSPAACQSGLTPARPRLLHPRRRAHDEDPRAVQRVHGRALQARRRQPTTRPRPKPTASSTSKPRWPKAPCRASICAIPNKRYHLHARLGARIRWLPTSTGPPTSSGIHARQFTASTSARLTSSRR